MPVTDLHAARQGGAAAADVEHLADDAESALYWAVWAHTDGDRVTAAKAARRAAEFDPGSELARLLAAYLGGEGPVGGVYDSPDAFRAFTRGGGNIPLYAATSAALWAAHSRWPGMLLDIGVGDGRALLPALSSHIGSVDVVEPSGELLKETVAELTRLGVPHRAYYGVIEDFARDHNGRQWDITQATFALQSLEPAQRRDTLRWIRAHTRALVLVEFDVPHPSSPFEPDWFRSCIRSTERGLREYDEDRDLVALGFILPVVLGFFDTHGRRTNWEQPISAWSDDLQDAGFAHVSSQHLYDYWWRPAWMLEAH
jgi:hypothetical protein